MMGRITLSLLLLASSASALADTPINEVRPGQPGMHLRVDSIAGSVRLSPGEDDQVVIRGTLGEGSKPLKIDGSGSRLTIQVEAEGNGWGSGRIAPSSLDILLPVSARVEVNTVSADVVVSAIAGNEVRIETVSGDIDYRGDAERVRLKSVSGSIHGEGGGQHWTVATVSGRITMPEAIGEVLAESVSGTINVAFGRAHRLHAETVSGRIEASGALTREGEIDIQSVSGALDLGLAGQTDARIQARTFSGKVESDFGEAERSGFGGGYTLDTQAGSGSGSVRVESFSGKVTIRRID